MCKITKAVDSCGRGSPEIPTARGFRVITGPETCHLVLILTPALLLAMVQPSSEVTGGAMSTTGELRFDSTLAEEERCPHSEQRPCFIEIVTILEFHAVPTLQRG